MNYRDYIKVLEENRENQYTMSQQSKEGEFEQVTVYTDQGPITRTVYNVDNTPGLVSKVKYEGVCKRDVEFDTYPENFASLVYERRENPDYDAENGEDQYIDSIYGTVAEAFDNVEVSFSSDAPYTKDNAALQNFDKISSNFRVYHSIISKEMGAVATEVEPDFVCEP